jgi:hypothetical protein
VADVDAVLDDAGLKNVHVHEPPTSAGSRRWPTRCRLNCKKARSTTHSSRPRRCCARLIEETSYRSVLSFRLIGGNPAALHLFAERAGAFTDADIDLATVLAAHASSLLALYEAEDHAANLETALESNRDIGAAVGVLMAHHQVTQQDAFTLLRVASQSLHRKLRDVATEVVETGALPPPPATDP